MDLWVKQSRQAPLVRYEQAVMFAQAGKPDRAEQILRALPSDIPDAAGNAYLRGTIAINLGQLDEAREHLRRAASANPGSGQIWLALMRAGPPSPEDAETALNAGLTMRSAPALERAAYHYALGEINAAQNDPPAAFEQFSAGAKLAREARRYEPEADRRNADDARSGWTKGALGGGGAGAGDSRVGRAIFVTGLPRSGTTLIEQILASHGAVDGGDELGLLRLLEQDIGGKSRAHYERYLKAGGSAETLQNLYDHLLSERFPGSGRVVDKTLNASRYMGLISVLFPDAPIIWVRRDPLDCAWSAYRTWFARGVDWSWSLGSIAEHFRLEDALYRHWTGMFGNRILTVQYSDLIDQPEQQIGRIADHCGLAIEPAMLRSHETERLVTTASVSQVREPINRKGTGSAQPYREFLQPFVDAYHN